MKQVEVIMNIKEISEIRRHIHKDRCNISAIYGCYVNQNKEIIAKFKLSTGMMSENEREKYFGLLKRSLSGILGKHLIDIPFDTQQVASGEEHKLLMNLRKTGLEEEETRNEFFQKVVQSLSFQDNYLILIGCDHYDVPFRGKDGSTDGGEETFSFLLCAICPVKQGKPSLYYIPEEKIFHEGGILNTVSAPELGFLFPAFDNRCTNIYNALYYTRSAKESHESFVDAIFHTRIPLPAAEQKKCFDALLSNALQKDCQLEVVQAVHDELRQRMDLHKESRIPDPLLISKEEVKQSLQKNGIKESEIAKFSVDFDEAFGFEALLHPKNIIDTNRFEIKLPDVSIKVAPDKTDLIQTRVIAGVKYILIQAEESVEVNGVSIHIGDDA